MPMKFSHAAIAGGLALVAVVALRAANPPHRAMAAVTSACKPGDFALKNMEASRHFAQASLNGTIVSRCREAAIVRLRWIVQNEDGTTSSFPFLAHDGAPIGPNESYLFAVNEPLPPGKASWRLVVDGIAG